MIDKEIFKDIVDFALAIRDGKVTFDFENLPKEQNPARYAVYIYAIHRLGYTSLPQVVSNANFKRIKTKRMFRGINNIKYHNDVLSGEDFHYGYGNYGYGLYFAHDRGEALAFAGYAKSNVLKAHFAEDTALADWDHIMGISYAFIYKNENLLNERSLELYHEIAKIENEQDREFIYKMFEKDLSLLALALGYDGMFTDQDDHMHLITTLFNRSKLVVSESEYERITGKKPSELE